MILQAEIRVKVDRIPMSKFSIGPKMSGFIKFWKITEIIFQPHHKLGQKYIVKHGLFLIEIIGQQCIMKFLI